MVYLDVSWEDGIHNPKVLATRMTVFENTIRTGGFRQPLLKSVPILSEEIDENFAVGGRPPWAPLSPKTIARKKKNAHSILIESGALRRSASAHNRWHVSNDIAAYGNLPNSVSYGYYHLEATYTRPIRDWLTVNGNIIDTIGVTIFEPWLDTKLSEAGI